MQFLKNSIVFIFLTFICFKVFLCREDAKVRNALSSLLKSKDSVLAGSLKKKETFWPQPQFATEGSTLLTLSPSFNVSYEYKFKDPQGPVKNFIANSIQPFFSSPVYDQVLPESFLTSSPTNSTCNLLNELTISISSSNLVLSPDIDESYEIRVFLSTENQKWKAQIDSNTVFGALRAVQTFFQVIFYTSQSSSSSTTKYTRYLINAPHAVRDFPRFSHRGIMLDTSRHFFSVEFLVRLLDAMSYNKLNVFHWHIVDNQSFPVHIKQLPQLANLGAYSANETYSRADISRLVQYAYYKGIRIIPEIDVPGHCSSWASAFPEIVTFYKPTDFPIYGYAPSVGHLNPVIEKTYAILDTVVSELSSLFPDPYFHIGFDEIIQRAWLDDPQVQSFFSKNYAYRPGTGSPELNAWMLNILMDEFSRRLEAIVKKNKKQAMAWSDSIHNYNLTTFDSKTTVLQVWHGSTLKSVVNKGYQVVCSFQSTWYFDAGIGEWISNIYTDPITGRQQMILDSHNPNYNKVRTWQQVYELEPCSGLSPSQEANVLGGEAAMWTEMIDENGAENLIWPRACGVAERLWSSRYQTLEDSTPFRLSKQINRMASRGVRVSQFWPKWCEKHPYNCQINYP